MLLQRLALALNKAKIKYALLGGYAVSLQGAVRGTVDVDLCIALTEESFVKTEVLLKKLELLPRLPVTAKEVFQFRKEYIEKRNLIAWSFYNPKSPSEVVDIIITEDAQKMKLDKFFIQNTPVFVASKKDLIRMKKACGRPQDLLDVEALERVKDGKE